jgi:hypothetical protein
MQPAVRGGLCTILHPNFHEKALFVKADVAALEIVDEHNGSLRPSRYASIRTLEGLTLFGDPVHHEIRLFGLPRRRCNLRIGLSSEEGGPSSHGAVAFYEIRSDGASEAASLITLHDRRCSRLSPPSFAFTVAFFP